MTNLERAPHRCRQGHVLGAESYEWLQMENGRLRLQQETLKRLAGAVRMHVLFLTRRTQPCDCVSADVDCAGCVEHYQAGEAAFEELLAALKQAEQEASG